MEETLSVSSSSDMSLFKQFALVFTLPSKVRLHIVLVFVSTRTFVVGIVLGLGLGSCPSELRSRHWNGHLAINLTLAQSQIISA